MPLPSATICPRPELLTTVSAEDDETDPDPVEVLVGAVEGLEEEPQAAAAARISAAGTATARWRVGLSIGELRSAHSAERSGFVPFLQHHGLRKRKVQAR